MRPIRILFFQGDFSTYQSGYYQRDFLEALSGYHQVFPYGPGYPYYDQRHTIREVLTLCPFEPELLCFGAGWERDDHPTEFDPHPAIRAGKVRIPKVMILNKEYKKLKEKFDYILKNGIDLVFTAHHHAERWERELGVPFKRLPFAANSYLFKDYRQPKRYDLGFSGSLHAHWTDIRLRIKKRLFLMGKVKRPRFWRLRLYWGQWGRGDLVGEPYARLINSSKMWLATPSALEIVGTRFFEVMASRTLLLCSRSKAYDGLFEDGVHCVMFEPDLSDFEEMIWYYLKREREREEIVERGFRHVLEHHTWKRRTQQFTEEVIPLIDTRSGNKDPAGRQVPSAPTKA